MTSAIHPAKLAENLEWLESKLGYTFQDRGLLVQALTHRSFAHEAIQGNLHGNAHGTDVQGADNERLEFLGDAAIKLTISAQLMRQFPLKQEGFLTKTRAFLISDKHLAAMALELGLERHLLLGRGLLEDPTRASSPGLFASTFEALVGAVYLDAGAVGCDQLLCRLFEPSLASLSDGSLEGFQDEKGVLFQDYKSALQDRVAKQYKVFPEYKELQEDGPPQDRTFFVAVAVNGRILGHGHGRSKKQAGQGAAKEALERLIQEEAALSADPLHGLEASSQALDSLLHRAGIGSTETEAPSASGTVAATPGRSGRIAITMADRTGAKATSRRDPGI